MVEEVEENMCSAIIPSKANGPWQTYQERRAWCIFKQSLQTGLQGRVCILGNVETWVEI